MGNCRKWLGNRRKVASRESPCDNHAENETDSLTIPRAFNLHLNSKNLDILHLNTFKFIKIIN